MIRILYYFVGVIPCTALVLSCDAGNPLHGIAPAPRAEGLPAYVTGLLEGAAADGTFLKPGPYARIERRVESYAYYVGENGTCESAWMDTADLEIGQKPACEGRRNKRTFVPDRVYEAEFSLRTDQAVYPLATGWQRHPFERYEIGPDDLVAIQRLKFRDGYFYFNGYCLDAPAQECERIRFTVERYNPQQPYVVVGAMAAEGFGPYQPADGEAVYYIAGEAHLEELKKLAD